MHTPTAVMTGLALLACGATAEARGQSTPQLLEFQVIFSEKGPSWTSARSPALGSLQQAHQAFHLRLIAEGKLMVAGPFETQDSDQVRGMAIGCRLSREQVSTPLAADPRSGPDTW